MTNIVNLTPHTVRIVDDQKNVIAEYPSQGSCRVKTAYQTTGTVNQVPVLKTTYGETEGLPDPAENTIYIVSMVVAQANPTREDLVCPNSAPDQSVRDEAGQIFGVKSFAKY
jgi:hypothetical protein